MRSAAKMECSDGKEVEIGRWCREREKAEDLFHQAKINGYYVAYNIVITSL